MAPTPPSGRDVQILLGEVRRHLDGIDAFRAESREPHWRLESEPAPLRRRRGSRVPLGAPPISQAKGETMRFLAIAVAALGLLAFVPVANAATPISAQVAKLQKQVKALQAEVKDLRGQLELNYEGDTCLGAQTADLIQGTWGVIDQIASKTYFGPQTAVNDYGNCDDLARPDVPRPGIRVPPTIAPFLPLLQWLHEPL
jgi:hypothetical protein